MYIWINLIEIAFSGRYMFSVHNKLVLEKKKLFEINIFKSSLIALRRLALVQSSMYNN